VKIGPVDPGIGLQLKKKLSQAKYIANWARVGCVAQWLNVSPVLDLHLMGGHYFG